MINKFVLLILMICCTLAGCMSNQNIQAIHQWEGHYYTTNEFYNATRTLDLDKNESIWVLSNSTLKRLLTNIGK